MNKKQIKDDIQCLFWSFIQALIYSMGIIVFSMLINLGLQHNAIFTYAGVVSIVTIILYWILRNT